MKKLLASLVIIFSLQATAQQIPLTRFEKSGGKQTSSYPQIIDWWQKLDAASGKVKTKLLCGDHFGDCQAAA